ncbi:MAG: hypothetical protein V7K90_21920 [Nostoc sp.]
MNAILASRIVEMPSGVAAQVYNAAMILGLCDRPLGGSSLEGCIIGIEFI